MKKVKVRIYKDPNGQGKYVNKTAKFLKKARGGMQVDDLELEEDILNQLTLTQDVDVIASKLQDDYGLDYFEALDQIENIVDGLYKQGVTETKDEILNQDPDIDQPVVVKPKLYSTDEEWISDDNTGWDDFGEETEDAEGTSEDDDLAQEDQEALSLEKKGGAVNKKKFVKTVVTGLRKAAEGMEQDQSSNSSILDTPIGGREAHINLFRRGMKDLGNEFYAKKIYDSTQELQNQVQNLPPSPMGVPRAQEGFQVQEQDVENPMHHLGAYGNTVGNIFKTNMNQIHGAGFENIPEARRGREQRQADRQQRQVSKDWQNTFGDIAAGYFGVPGMPNYLQVISPQVVSPQANGQGAQGPAGPLVDVQFKKGPWWTGKREWSAKGIPAEMLMGMSGGRNGRMPGYGYIPSNSWSNSSSWSTQRTFPGEIVRTTSRTINAAADPTKKSGTGSTKAYPGYMELNPAPEGTEMVYDAQGNEVMAISPDEAARRKAAGNAAQYPWMTTGSNINFIPEAASNTSSVELNNNPEDNSTAQNLEENEYERSFMDLTLDPENKMHQDKFSFMNVQDPEELKQGNFDNYYFTDPATGQTYMSNNYGSEFSPSKQSWNPVSLPAEQMKRLGHPIQHWDANPNDPEGAPVYNPDKTQWYSPDQWMQFRYNENKEMGQPFDEDKYYQTNYPDEYGKLVRAYGGPVSNPQMDPNGNLQRFIYGGGDDVSPIVSYDDNYINSKNVEDPYMFREGGLYKYSGPQQSQVTQGTTGNDYSTWAKSRAEQAALDEYNAYMNRTNGNASNNVKYNANPNDAVYQQILGKHTGTSQNQNQSTTTTNTQTQNQTQQGYNTYGGGYPTAMSLKDQILDKFSPFKKNKETGKYYDFMWASQRGPATTLDGKPYQPQGQPGATNQPQGQTTNQGQPGTGQPGQPGVRPAGYVYDYEMKKGPWWGGNKQSLKATARWYDPNNPNSGASANAGQFNNGKGPTLDAANTNQPTTTTNKPVLGSGPTAPTQTTNNTGVQPNGTRYVEGMEIGKNQMLQTNTDANGNPMGIDSKGRLVNVGGNEGKGLFNEVKDAYGNIKNMFSGKRYDFGGYVPEFNPGGQFSGAGPFDPNDTGIAGGGTGPCTEDQVKNAQPGDPCYNEDYMKSLSPQDFSVEYDLNKARTLDFGNIGNIGMGAAALTTAVGDTANAMYNENYLDSRTDSGNRQAVNYDESHGAYDALGQRIGAKTQGRGTKGFNRVVGDAAFTREGGELKYQKGGVYDLTQEEIGKILAAGGQIKFIK